MRKKRVTVKSLDGRQRSLAFRMTQLERRQGDLLHDYAEAIHSLSVAVCSLQGSKIVSIDATIPLGDAVARIPRGRIPGLG